MGEPAPAEPRDGHKPQRSRRPGPGEPRHQRPDRKPAQRKASTSAAPVPPRIGERDAGHLPAFLLRPVSLKA
jgi:hypothetical protein